MCKVDAASPDTRPGSPGRATPTRRCLAPPHFAGSQFLPHGVSQRAARPQGHLWTWDSSGGRGVGGPTERAWVALSAGHREPGREERGPVASKDQPFLNAVIEHLLCAALPASAVLYLSPFSTGVETRALRHAAEGLARSSRSQTLGSQEGQLSSACAQPQGPGLPAGFPVPHQALKCTRVHPCRCVLGAWQCHMPSPCAPRWHHVLPAPPGHATDRCLPPAACQEQPVRPACSRFYFCGFLSRRRRPLRGRSS